VAVNEWASQNRIVARVPPRTCLVHQYRLTAELWFTVADYCTIHSLVERMSEIPVTPNPPGARVVMVFSFFSIVVNAEVEILKIVLGNTVLQFFS
jgi:hypothetical protein